MQLFFVVVLCFLCAVSGFAPAGRMATSALQMAGPGMNFGGGSSSRKPASKAAPAAVSVKGKGGKSAPVKLESAIDKKFGKDMRWGGRPDAAPEMIVRGASVPFTSPGYVPKSDDSAGGFLEAAWRYNRR